ncbi:MAG: type II toxin-antitoxin system VapC family toxin [Chloroflexi bacterium]|nr:type II toxin-antitoxin system VapC family toxin [Chloroflexota bacterium]
MRYLLDADWVIRFLQGRRDAGELIGTLADEGLGLSIITYGEIWEGLLSTQAEQRVDDFNEFVACVDLVTLDVDAARHYGRVRSRLRSEGLLIPDNDLWLAATAVRHDLTLISFDQHFTRVPGLKVYHHP